MTEFKLGELQHHVLQAVSRGRLQICKGDQAEPCEVWLISDERNGLADELNTMFPDATVMEWDGGPGLRRNNYPLREQSRDVAIVVRTHFNGQIAEPTATAEAVPFAPLGQIIREEAKAPPPLWCGSLEL